MDGLGNRRFTGQHAEKQHGNARLVDQPGCLDDRNGVGRAEAEVLGKHLYQEPPPLLATRPATPEDLDRLEKTMREAAST